MLCMRPIIVYSRFRSLMIRLATVLGSMMRTRRCSLRSSTGVTAIGVHWLADVQRGRVATFSARLTHD